jgi:hypothetical protein
MRRFLVHQQFPAKTEMCPFNSISLNCILLQISMKDNKAVNMENVNSVPFLCENTNPKN